MKRARRRTVASFEFFLVTERTLLFIVILAADSRRRDGDSKEECEDHNSCEGWSYELVTEHKRCEDITMREGTRARNGNPRASEARKATGLFESAGLPKEAALHARDDP